MIKYEGIILIDSFIYIKRSEYISRETYQNPNNRAE